MKPIILFRWSDSTRATQDDRKQAADIIRAHRRGQRRGESARVLYDRATHRIEVFSCHSPELRGIWTRL